MPPDPLEKFSDYLRHQRGLSPNTVITYRHHARSYLRFLAKEGIAVAEIEKESVRNFIESLRRQNKRSATLFVTHIALRTFHEFLCTSKVLTDNPMIDLALPKIQSRVPEPLELEQIDRLLSASSARALLDLRDRAIDEFLFCGLRMGEMLNLDWSDVDFNKLQIRITPKDNWHPKDYEAREIDLHPTLEEHLKAWRSVCQNHTRVLPWERRTNQMSNMFKNFLKRSGITKGSLHTLRHSFASHLAMADVNLAKIAKLMGHSDIRTTQIYAHLQPSSLKEAVFRLPPIS